MNMDNVIIADDSAMARMFVRRCFEVAGLADSLIREADCGNEVLKLLEESPADLIITDLNMPNMDGRELLKAVKQREATRGIPVIVVTSVANASLSRELQAAGATIVMKKPPNPVLATKALDIIKSIGGGT
jgi:two-component system chemotaxis response regulator CheY